MKIKEGINNDESDRVVDAAHSLKKASANLGFMDISCEAKTIEQRAHDNSLENLTDNVNKITEELAMIAKALEG